jgi:hypothetical protein
MGPQAGIVKIGRPLKRRARMDEVHSPRGRRFSRWTTTSARSIAALGRSAVGLGCVETQLKGGRGRQSLQAADVFASDRLCNRLRWLLGRAASLLDALPAFR